MRGEYDTIIVGSGVAATLICQQMLENNPAASILVLEAGPAIEQRNRRAWWDMTLLGRGASSPYDFTYDIDEGQSPESTWTGSKWGFRESRVRAVGGSTMHWGGWSLRFQPEDFQAFSRTGKGADWPISYDELAPWYGAAERVLCVSGSDGEPGPPRTSPYPMPVFPWTAHEAFLADAFEASGLVPGHMPIARFARCMTTGTCKYCPIGARYNATEHMAHLLHDKAHTGFELVSNTPVVEVVANGASTSGVRVIDPADGQSRHVGAQRVVICAGAYESPKLLLRSRSTDWPNGVGNQHDQVGRYLVTHAMLRVRATYPTNAERWFQEYDFPTLMSRSWDTPQRQAAGKVFVFNNRSLPNTDIAGLMSVGKTRAQVFAELDGPRTAGLDAFVEEFGSFNSRVTLGTSSGQFGLPATTVHFERDAGFGAHANSVLDEMLTILTRAGHSPAAARAKELQDPRGDHSSGTCRMGQNPSNSVTNSDLRVHGLGNLYVCSNATFPTAASVNPTLTLAALALRLGSTLSHS